MTVLSVIPLSEVNITGIDEIWKITNLCKLPVSHQRENIQ